MVEGDALEHDSVQLGIAFARQTLQLLTQGTSRRTQAAALQLPLWNLHGIGHQLCTLLTCLHHTVLRSMVHHPLGSAELDSRSLMESASELLFKQWKVGFVRCDAETIILHRCWNGSSMILMNILTASIPMA